MAPSFPEPLELEQEPTTTSESAPSRPARPVVGTDVTPTRRTTASALWPFVIALVAGCTVAGMLLSSSLRVEFPLFSEASAERGRDCTAITSARHALDATLQARLPMRAPDVESARAIRSAIAAFDARTQDIATPSVDAALAPVRGGLDDLSDSVQAYASSPASTGSATGVQDALTRVTESWKGAIARVCS